MDRVWFIINPDETDYSEEELLGIKPGDPINDAIVSIWGEQDFQNDPAYQAWIQKSEATRGKMPVPSDPVIRKEFIKRIGESQEERFRLLTADKVEAIYQFITVSVAPDLYRTMIMMAGARGEYGVRFMLRTLRSLLGPVRTTIKPRRRARRRRRRGQVQA